jgi:hypothetical protein
MKNALKKIAAVAVVLSLCLATAACTPQEEDDLREYILGEAYPDALLIYNVTPDC